MMNEKVHAEIRDSFRADFYAPLDYIAGHKYARAALEKLFEVPFDKYVEQKNLTSYLIEAEKQLDTLVELGAVKSTGTTLNPKYSITLKGHDALVTYQILYDEAKQKRSNKEARQLVRMWLRQI